MADGQKDRATERCRKILPVGAIQIKWAADTEYEEQETLVWSILNPAACNKDVQLGWRFAASKLMNMKAAMKRKRSSTGAVSQRQKTSKNAYV